MNARDFDIIQLEAEQAVADMMTEFEANWQGMRGEREVNNGEEEDLYGQVG